MPITQQRFWSMIQAARSFYDAAQHLTRAIELETELAQAGRKSHAEALHAIHHSALSLQFNPNYLINLGSEEKHYQKTAYKNEKTAARMAKKRRNEGTQPRKPRTKPQRDEVVEVEWDDSVLSSDANLTLDDPSTPLPPTEPTPSPLALAAQVIADNAEIAKINELLATEGLPTNIGDGRAEDESPTKPTT